MQTYARTVLFPSSPNDNCHQMFQFDSSLIISFSLAQMLSEKFFQLARILSEFTNTLRQLVRSHLILIQQPAECLLVHSDPFNISLTSCKQNYCLTDVNSLQNCTAWTNYSVFTWWSGFDSALSSKRIQTFQRNILPLFSGSICAGASN